MEVPYNFSDKVQLIDPGVGFMDWLDPLLGPFLAAAILVTDVKDCVIRVSLEA